MTSTIKIYIASPFGFFAAGRDFMQATLIPLIQKAGFVVLDPWALTPQELIKPVVQMPYGEKKRQELQRLNRLIGENNTRALDEAHAVVAVLDGTDVDSGTASEIGYACALGKPVLGYRSDFRLSGDNEGCTVNLQVEYFIEKNGGKIVTRLDDLEAALQDLFKRLSPCSGPPCGGQEF
jgi:nucleoside 2-deoxyribosyltransferase